MYQLSLGIHSTIVELLLYTVHCKLLEIQMWAKNIYLASVIMKKNVKDLVHSLILLHNNFLFKLKGTPGGNVVSSKGLVLQDLSYAGSG